MYPVVPNDMLVKIQAMGHPNIIARHQTTIELTKETWLSLKGDCIIGVNASHALSDLPSAFRRIVQKETTKITLQILVSGEPPFVVTGWGHPDLSYECHESMICRTSKYVDYRTLMIRCDRAASSLPRSLVKRLQDPHLCFNVELFAVQGST